MTNIMRSLYLGFLLAAATSAPAQWRVLSPSDQRQSQPPKNFSEGTPIKLGDSCPEDQKFRWLVAELAIPATVGNESTAGKIVGLNLHRASLIANKLLSCVLNNKRSHKFAPILVKVYVV